MKRRFWILLLTACLLLGTAQADGLYAIEPAPCDVDALRLLTFGDDASAFLSNVLPSGSQVWLLHSEGGMPFCAAGKTDGPAHAQSRISLFRKAYEGHEPHLSENVVPGGRIEGGFAPEEARRAAACVLEQLAVQDAVYLSTTAYGRLSASQGYLVTFLQTLNGLPVYWCDMLDEGAQVHTNRVDVVLDAFTGELLCLEADWSRFTAIGQEQSELTADSAAQRFLALGLSPVDMERCYLLSPGNGDEAVAYPAWRVRNTFLNALTGEWLQRGDESR